VYPDCLVNKDARGVLAECIGDFATADDDTNEARWLLAFRSTTMRAAAAKSEELIQFSSRTRFRVAMILAILADALQVLVLPLFAEGGLSPADDVLDLVVAAVLVNLLGWHWEFLPAFFAELVPGVDLVPFWTLAVVSVYRKWKQATITNEEIPDQRRALKDPQNS